MQISWHGLSCFSLTVSSLNGEATMVIDPYQNATGLKLSRAVAADVIAVTHDDEDANNVDGVTEGSHGKPFVITMPGEYESKGIFVHAIPAATEQMLLLVESEGINVAHLGALNRALSDTELDALNNVDILFVPVGGGRFLSPKAAAEVIAQIEPRIVVPYAYELDGLTEKLQPLDAFCKALGVCKRENVSKLKISRKNLPEEEMMIYVLERA